MYFSHHAAVPNSDTDIAVTVRLSRYLECGQNLTQLEAVLMTSCISKRVTALHRQGLTHGAINAANIYVEKDVKVREL